MAAVIFIVTVPTSEEEQRLKKAYIGRKVDHVEPQVITTAIARTVQSSAQTTENLTPSGTIILDIPSTPVTTNNAPQYGTFSKQPVQNRPEAASKLNEVMSAGSKTTSVTTPLQNSEFTDAEQNKAPRIMRKSLEGLRDILASAKQKSPKDQTETFCDGLNVSSDTSMEIVLREILKVCRVMNAVWTKDAEGRMLQVTFTVDFNERYENILDKFYEWGIGDREGSTVSVMNCIAAKSHIQNNENDLKNDDQNNQNINDQKQRSAWERFMNTVRSRLNVAQIVRDVRQDASITFDFIVLLISAAILASFGLIEDSTIFLASSMLISPLMGPIIAAIFGTVIKERSLTSLGIKNELFGIILATLVGFVFGLVVGIFDERYGVGEGLTTEMLSRCDLHSLIVGMFTAIPSGAAAAIGILGGNIGSLVGVAISASILPPAVNSGLLWALACIYKFFETDNSRFNNVVRTNYYSNDQATELAFLASISMCLTISNVLFVYIIGIFVLKVKEIAPVISRKNRQFWKHDIKIARDLCKNGFDSSADTAIITEFTSLPKEDQDRIGFNCDLLHKIGLDEAGYQNTWSPMCQGHPSDFDREPIYGNYSTVHRIERLYSTNARKQLQNERRRKFSFSRRPTGLVNDIRTTYTLLTENIAECTTKSLQTGMQSTLNFGATNANECLPDTTIPSLTKSMIEDNKRRKFIVTPAVDTIDSPPGTNKTDEMRDN